MDVKSECRGNCNQGRRRCPHPEDCESSWNDLRMTLAIIVGVMVTAVAFMVMWVLR